MCGLYKGVGLKMKKSFCSCTGVIYKGKYMGK